MFAAGNSVAPSGPANYIEDVFSTYLYTGTGANLTITNGINLAGKGGMVWIKQRSTGQQNNLFDTARGALNILVSNTTAAQDTVLNTLTSFNSNGFNLGSDVFAKGVNTSTATYASWTFREQPKFFDVVTYTGTGVARTVAHNLGSAPGCMIIKRTEAAGNAWYAYHRSLGATKVIYLNQTDAAATVTSPWNDTEPTSTEFTVGANNNNNASGGSFVAYLFAHNAGGFGLTGTDNVISCGSYTATSSTVEVNLGWEPQWLLVKRATGTSGDVDQDAWHITDNMRRMTAYTSASTPAAELRANAANAEVNLSTLSITSTGFIAGQSNWNTTASGAGNYIYIAIRRGPMKVPTLGTSVFSVDTTTADSAITSTLKQTDMGWFKDRTTVANWFVADRLRNFTGAYYTPTLYTNVTDAEVTPTTGDTVTAFGPTTTGVTNGVIYAGGAGVAANYPLLYSFKRAPGFFDEVCYTATNSGAFRNHNLNVVPELIIDKRRDATGTNDVWYVWHTSFGITKNLQLNSTSATTTSPVFITGGSQIPTATQFLTESQVASTRVAYLFASCSGVSKVGSYTGTGALQTIACGFTTGARFVLIKRTDSTGDWYVWDSARGITSGNDPYLLINSTAAEITATNYVDTDTTGFKVTAAAPAALNAVGGTYIFLAIA